MTAPSPGNPNVLNNNVNTANQQAQQRTTELINNARAFAVDKFTKEKALFYNKVKDSQSAGNNRAMILGQF
jgi:hypothetical protein